MEVANNKNPNNLILVIWVLHYDNYDACYTKHR